MAKQPARDVALRLSSQSLGTFPGSIFTGAVLPPSQYIPTKAIFVSETGGPAAQRVFGLAHEHRRANVQVRIRSTDYTTGQQVAQQAYDALESADLSGYLDVACIGLPIFTALDENGMYHFSLNAQLFYTT